MEVEVVEDRLWVDLGPRSGQGVGIFREQQTVAVDPVTQGAGRKAINGEDGAARGLPQAHRKITADANDGLFDVAVVEPCRPCGAEALLIGLTHRTMILETRGSDAEEVEGGECWNAHFQCYFQCAGTVQQRTLRCQLQAM